MDRTFELIADRTVRNQDTSWVLARMLANRVTGPYAWSKFKDRWDGILEIAPPMTQSRIADGFPALSHPEVAADVAAFLAENPLPHAAKAVEQKLERLRAMVMMRERETGPVVTASWSVLREAGFVVGTAATVPMPKTGGSRHLVLTVRFSEHAPIARRYAPTCSTLGEETGHGHFILGGPALTVVLGDGPVGRRRGCTPDRDVRVEWEPISLMFKNNPEPGSDRHRTTSRTHGMLRVMESVRTELGNEGVFQAYWAFATRIHHDRSLFDFDVAQVLAAIGIDSGHARAFGDGSWDGEIRRRMDAGLALVGDDVGTPIIAMEDARGDRVGMFGPVITRVPGRDRLLAALGRSGGCHHRAGLLGAEANPHRRTPSSASALPGLHPHSRPGRRT